MQNRRPIAGTPPRGQAGIPLEMSRAFSASVTVDRSAPDTRPDSSQGGLGETVDASRADAAAVDTTGLRTVDRQSYVIEGEVGRGGLGRVLLARERGLDRRVALKEVLRDDPGTIARFVREARITAKLQHPNIVPIYEGGRWPDGEPFYAMRLITGRSLAAVVKDTQTLDERLPLVPSLVATADAIAYAHSRRIIHRDLKPANVLLGAFGETVVIDWGLAKDLTEAEPDEVAFGDAPGEPALTVAGALVGTPAYMAPEQARGEALDERADVFALGALMYHVLTGAAPFRGPSALAVIALAVEAAPVDIEVAQPGVPRDLATIVRKAMAPLPAERYPSARELADDLRRFQAGQLVSAHRYSPGALLGRWLRRHRVAVAVAVASLAALTLILVVSVRRIVLEKDRAEARTGELILAQARLSLDRDPTAALAWLKSYPKDAPGWGEARIIAVDARFDGAARHVLATGHTDTPRALAFEDGGRRLAAFHQEEVLRWDVGSGALVSRAPFDGAQLPDASPLDLLPAQGGFVSAGDGGVLRLWDAERRERGRLLGHPHPVLVVAASADGARVASADSGNELRLWDVASGAGRVVGAHQGQVLGLGFSPDGRLLASTAQDEVLHLFRIETGETAVVRGHGDLEHALAFSPDGRLLATSGGSEVRVWDVRPPIGRSLRGHEARVTHVLFSPDGRLLATLSDRTVRIWDVATSRLVQSGEHEDSAYGLAFSPDGHLLATAGADATVRLWTVGSGDVKVLRGHEGRVRDVAFSPDGVRLATGGRDGTVRLWRVPGGEVHTLGRFEGSAMRVLFSPDGTKVAGVGEDRSVRVWDVEGGAERVLGRHPTEPFHLLFLTDGELVSASDETIKVWDLTRGSERELPRLFDSNSRVVASPDGRTLAVPSGDRIALFDVATLERRDLLGHDRAVHRCRFSHDGRRLVSVSDDGTVRVWDLATGAVRIVHRHQGVVFDVGFSPDDRLVASGSVDQTAWIGAADEGEEDALPPDPAAVRAALGRWTTAVATTGSKVRTP